MDTMTRIAVVNSDRCKPWKCQQECKKTCPVNRAGKPCVEVTPSDKVAFISESLCVGAGICAKKCPFDAVSIINLPTNLNKDTTHRYGANSFKLHRLPIPRTGSVLGLVGCNGIGKSTALKILAGKLKPNLGEFNSPPEWKDILVNFRGTALQNYFKKIIEDNLKSIVKPQYVDQMQAVVKGTVREFLDKRNDMKNKEEVCDLLDLESVMDSEVKTLSGGEVQRFAIAVVCVQKADIFVFDEPSSFLDIKQRLRAAQVIRQKVADDSYVLVVEHDLSVLDYLSDYICCLYGVPGAYGVVTMPAGVREGINVFLEGFLPSENMRFRPTSLSFRVAQRTEFKDNMQFFTHTYDRMTKKLGKFELEVESGEFSDSEIIVMLGENGTGKTTLIRMLAGRLDPDDGVKPPKLSVSYKPQKISPKYQGTVRELLHHKIQDAYLHPQFVSDVYKPLQIGDLIDLQVQNLSGGELQRVAITLCLGTPADVYLIDEPSAYLDSEQRVNTAKTIKRFILHARKTAFIVEHDFIMATYLADRVIVFEGEPSAKATASGPESLLNGMNKFLQSMDISFRRDPHNHRPMINKLNGARDREQKAKGNYFFLED